MAGIEPPGGSKGNSYNNALAEVIHRRSWPTRESVKLATLEWVSWFNHRLLGPIRYISPAEAEANYHRQLASQTSMVAAWLETNRPPQKPGRIDAMAQESGGQAGTPNLSWRPVS